MLPFPLPALVMQTPAPAMTEAQKIEALIQDVERLQGQATFVRNGAEYDARTAADHLRLKWKNAGRRVKTAGDFIRGCATGSSISGKPYLIRFKDGREVTSSDWFWTDLKKLDPSVP